MSNEADSEFTAASALACLAHDESQDKGINKTRNGESGDFSIPQRFTKSGRKRAVPFTMKLMKVLSDKQYADIITWMPSGKSFNILKPKAFVAEVLPEHFKDAKYSSFTRKLHRWGFMRHYRGEEAGAFYHKDFQRGRLDLVEQMTCHKAEPPKSTAAISSAAAADVAVKPGSKPAPAPLRAPSKPPAAPVTIPKAHPATPQTAPTIKRTPLSLGANSSLPPLAPQLAPPAISAAAAATLDTDRLNAAIEMEVNRRIKERLNAVALSRQAFAVSALRQQQLTSQRHHQHLTLEATAASQVAAALLFQKQAGALKNGSVLGGLGLSIPSLGYRALTGEGQPMPGAPPTNIQGARTA